MSDSILVKNSFILVRSYSLPPLINYTFSVFILFPYKSKSIRFSPYLPSKNLSQSTCNKIN